MNNGDIIRGRNGDLTLWRVVDTYTSDSPYAFAVLVSNHKYHKAGTKKKLARKTDFTVEPDPTGFAHGHGFTVDLDVFLAPDARWA